MTFPPPENKSFDLDILNTMIYFLYVLNNNLNILKNGTISGK